MENSGKKNWLYGVIALLLLALVIETGFLISRATLKSKKKETAPQIQPYPSPSYSPRIPSRAPRPFRAARWKGEEWDPFEEIRKMQEEMNRLFDESFGRALRAPAWTGPAGIFSPTFQFSDFSPAVDLKETKDAYRVRADIPGLEKDKIQVSVSGNLLTIQGERREETEKEDLRRGFYASERSYGSFSRSLSLPGPVDESQVTAKYKDGVLTVTLPKLKGAASTQQRVQIS